MLVYIIKSKKLQTFTLPLEIKGNYWVNDTDENKNSRSLINIQESEGKWALSCNYDFDLYVNGEIVDKVLVQEDTFYFLKYRSTGEIISIFCTEIYANYNYYAVNDNSEVLIGKTAGCHIIYNNNLLGDQQAKLTYVNNKWQITNLNPNCNIYINNFSFNEYKLDHGDVIFIMGLKIIVLGSCLVINNPAGSVTCSLMPKQMEQMVNNESVEDDSTDLLVYQKKDYFNRSPRFISKVEKITMVIDDPPTKIKEDDSSLLITLGPMMTMSMTAVITIYTGVNRAVSEHAGINSVLPTIIMGVAMLATMVVWPLITRKYQDKRRENLELKRRDKYELYIQQKRQDIVRYITQQRQILEEDFPSLSACSEVILNKKTKLWERKADDEDFLCVRLGLGTVPLDIDIRYSEEKFSMETDILKEIIKNLVNESRDITGAPITVSLLEKRIAGVIGQYDVTTDFIKGILLQLISFYSSDILKIVILTNDENSYNWDCFKTLQHLWNNERTERFYGTNTEEIKNIFQYLDKELTTRMEEQGEVGNSSEEKILPTPYYFIFTDDYSLIADNNFIKKILRDKTNYGFSLLINDERVSNLPNECSCFININKESSGLIENELVSTNQKSFLADFPTNIDIKSCILTLSNIPINIDTKFGGLPDSYGFMELYQIGKVEQLNAANRWKSNDPTISLSTPIGVDENGATFKIDLHEKFHGPHGLVAGTTGSGKSEWIITFILSMAINYSPNEVSFVLIDYKGGGLALAFENKELGIKLPHIAGTITNLDTNELNRSLASIEAELKRRQREFNKARDISGESTIDIYKYQRLYRDGVVDKPISHLFIISDEFAELKAQQPDFMDQLVSTARIGRSLGVHLILATQKPSGVVNDQIWSNSRFKVCLKVQDKADSNDMIMVPDAASIKQAGRFYLLVGYNDYFAMGQSAYCGMSYVPSEKIVKKVDTFLTFVNNNGYVIKSVDDIKKQENTTNNGEVLLNVVKYLTKVAEDENIKVNQLWLDRIPNEIFVDDLKKKYNYQKEDFIINPVIGEYDDPSTQSQHLLTLPLTTVGSTAIYGMAGAGKEDLLAAMVYSIITTYSAEEVNLYIIDCGAETLKMFDKAPQVGDVMLSNDQEKIINFFKMITEIIENRKKLFVDYGGTLSSYNQLNANKMSTIVVIINGYENFMAYYEPLEDVIIKIGRDSLKYGIIFIFTGSASNAIKMRVKQNFTQNLALQLTDEFDYVNILGNVHRMKPSSNKGRGLVKFDEPYEFQSASITQAGDVLETVRDVCQSLSENSKVTAPPVPVLPEEVSIDNVRNKITTMNSVPIGIVKSTLEVATIDIINNYISVISSNNISNIKNFINGLTNVLLEYKQSKVIILDIPRLIDESLKDKLIYANANFDDLITQINNYFIALNEQYASNNYNNESIASSENMVIMLIGIDDLFNRISREIKDQFIKTINKAKPIGKFSFIIVDIPDKIKKMQYDDWYKNNTNANTGIWVGNGITDQSLLRSNSYSKELSIQIGNDFGYLLIEGTPVLVKFVKLTENETVEQLDL